MKDLAYLLELERETIEIPENEGTGELDWDLATQAAKVLGYTRLQTAVQNKTHALARVIKNLGIETFKKESVKAYQAAVIEEKRQEAIAAKSWAIQRFLARFSGNVFIPCSMCLLIFLMLGMVVAFGTSHLITGTIFSVLFVVFSLLFELSLFSNIPNFIWSRVSLDQQYTKEVWEFALVRAIAIKKALPSAQIFVEECAEIKDPFLVAVNGEEEYYFAVYDEPKFESNLSPSSN